jgi:hypothetical protein
MKRARYDDNSTVPVGFLDTANAVYLAAATPRLWRRLTQMETRSFRLVRLLLSALIRAM